MAPIAEIDGSIIKKLPGDLEVAYEEGEILLFPTKKRAAKTLIEIKTQHPKANLILKDDGVSDLSVEGVKVLHVTVATQRVRVMDPVAK